jgi:hypothetical protein
MDYHHHARLTHFGREQLVRKVILFFMHVKYQSHLIKVTVGAGFFIFLVLLTITLSGCISRAWGLW